ncbi:hypothetical protein HDU76_000105 [Blyttiomyces sp. JEL0837]|nr:hypothetical protein HDU76_000105 [Blyttiomyces sp. JEL0837]
MQEGPAKEANESVKQSSTFTVLRRELCNSLPLDKLQKRLENIQAAEAKDIGEIRRRYMAEAQALSKEFKP